MPTPAETHARVAAALGAWSDDALLEALRGATPVGEGIGGVVSTLEVASVPVFVKHVPLTDLERRDENRRSTANLFGLPLHAQYGVSSPGLGAWRELAVHELTTGWVLAGEVDCFPLLYHWRVLPRAVPEPLPAAILEDVERQFAAWGRSEAMRARFTARHRATASIVLFLERFPDDLRGWLGRELAAGGARARAAAQRVERGLLAGVSFMNARGLQHFDAHLDNVLTDGRRLALSDFGQALWSGFELTAEERAFLERHRDFDRSYVVAVLSSFVAQDPAGAEIVARYAAIVAVVKDFFVRLRADKTTPYPAEALAGAWAAIEAG